MRAPSIALALLSSFVCGALTAASPLTAQSAGSVPPTPPLAAPPALPVTPAAPTPPVSVAPPDTDLFVAELVRSGDRWSIERPRNVTQRVGYDNQPFYLPGGQRLLYTSQRGGQADIYELDVSAASERAATATPESEYSAQQSTDGKNMIVVRVEADGTQRLWGFPTGVGDPAVIAPEVKGVGYHAWLDATTVAVFVLGEPFTLQIVDLKSGATKTIAKEIGRSIHRAPGSRAVSFTAPGGERRAIFVWDAATETTRKLAPAPPTEEGDYAWTPDGVLLAGVGSTIHRLRPGVEADWVPIADLAGDGVGKITRLAVSPMGNQIAFVVDR